MLVNFQIKYCLNQNPIPFDRWFLSVNNLCKQFWLRSGLTKHFVGPDLSQSCLTRQALNQRRASHLPLEDIPSSCSASAHFQTSMQNSPSCINHYWSASSTPSKALTEYPMLWWSIRSFPGDLFSPQAFDSPLSPNPLQTFLEDSGRLDIIWVNQSDALAVGFTCWTSFVPLFSLIYCWVFIFALSPFYILIYMF